ncbi:hypothetical protein Smp_137820 [Schistosoma mansoni]|uniref:hypothetical protein n=1 Tax=Schistosoma mansoni TaxID=6183 RepID=UPI0001A6373F|nr:hypothetical protein Smp_137820 [Schistosoma mansoni]|eukprot:XP_018650814.1 hypothetical protein Smp_137820 [Schistosoma mansoni]
MFIKSELSGCKIELIDCFGEHQSQLFYNRIRIYNPCWIKYGKSQFDVKLGYTIPLDLNSNVVHRNNKGTTGLMIQPINDSCKELSNSLTNNIDTMENVSNDNFITNDALATIRTNRQNDDDNLDVKACTTRLNVNIVTTIKLMN